MWSKEEEEYLTTAWGNTSLLYISEKIGKSIAAVKTKASRLGLGNFLQSSELITFNELIKTLGKGNNFTTCKKKFKASNFPFKSRVVVTRRILMVNIDDFWEWAEKNQTKVNFANFERLLLGAEPKWVEEKRQRDKLNIKKVKKNRWSMGEIKRLKELVEKQKYTWKEISEMMKRTPGSINRKLIDFNIKSRPLSDDAHNVWSTEEIKILKKEVIKRSPYCIMCEKINKSEKAIRGKVYRMYGSENLDKAWKNAIHDSTEV